MALYLVTWEIEVEADSPRAAVEHAVECLPINGNDSTATVFTVVDQATQAVEEFDTAKDWT